MPAQILVTRMTRPDVEKKITELQADDILEAVSYAGRANCMVRSKIRTIHRGPELDRAYAGLQAIADVDAVIGAEQMKAREAKDTAVAAKEAAREAAEAAKVEAAEAAAAKAKETVEAKTKPNG